MFAIYDPIKKCGEISEYSILRCRFENVRSGFISITKCGGRICPPRICRTSLTNEGISRTDFYSRFVNHAVLDARLMAGTRLTRGDLARFARSGIKLHIDIQDLACAAGGYPIVCNPYRLMLGDGFKQMTAEAKKLPAFIGYFMDANDWFGAAVREISAEAVGFKLRWG